MTKEVALLLVVFVSTCLVRPAFLLDPCTLQPYPIPTAGQTIDVHTNKTCTKGDIWWNYPRGNLRVTFERTDPSGDFQVCLNLGGSFFLIEKILDVTDRQNPKQVPIPTTEHPSSCIRSGGVQIKQVVLEFQSANTLYYLAVMNYDIRPVS